MDDRELLMRLLEGEPRLNQQTIAEILGRGSDFAPSLERLIANIRLWHTGEEGHIAVFHAIKLLGAMKFTGSIATLVDAIFLAYDTHHEDALEELPVAFARIGPNAIEPLGSIMDDPKLHPAVRSIAATALEGIAVLHPDDGEEALETLRRALRQSGRNAGQFRTHLIGLITHFRRPGDRELVAASLREMPTALDISEEDVDTYFQSSTEPWEWAEYRVDPLEFYDDELA